MSRRLLILVLLTSFALMGNCAFAGISHYIDRGKTDFDNALILLNHYGTWSKVDNDWAYTPLDHNPPYTNGRWIYTEYGWYWKGNAPHSWVTEHYGYWKRGADKVWSWYPGPYWLPSIVEIRRTPNAIGWRSAAVDRDGSYLEAPETRYSKLDEWTFVTLEGFANPITPSSVVKPDEAQQDLLNSVDCRHLYLTYREIDRQGPHPADFVALCKDGKMFAPHTLQDELAEQATKAQTGPTLVTATNSAPATNAAPIAAKDPTSPSPDGEPPPDTRKVKYWITMSLPSFWAKPPEDAKAEEIYLYRPDFYQDEDGIARRITLWFNPRSRATLKDLLAGGLPGGSAIKPTGTNAPAAAQPSDAATPATPASPTVSAQPVKPHDPFRSPFEDNYHGSVTGSSPSSSKNPAPTGAVPSGRASDPVPAGTNATTSAH